MTGVDRPSVSKCNGQTKGFGDKFEIRINSISLIINFLNLSYRNFFNFVDLNPPLVPDVKES